jgi:hypothetical protein
VCVPLIIILFELSVPSKSLLVQPLGYVLTCLSQRTVHTGSITFFLCISGCSGYPVYTFCSFVGGPASMGC